MMFTISKQLDTRHLNPPQPLLRTLCAMQSLESGQILQLTTDKCDAITGMERLCKQTGLVLMQYSDWDGEYTFLIRKAGHASTQ